MTPREIAEAIRKRWWLVVLVPAIVFPLLVVRARTQPFQTSLNAVVLIPGDTEDPGNSERPELMVLDDLPSLISSRVFAEAVAQDLAARGGEAELATDVDAIRSALSASRYSRVLTVRVTRDDAESARAIGVSAAAVLPDAVNRYLVADPAEPATVQVIDPPAEPTRSRPNQTLIIAAMTLVAVAAGAGIAIGAESWSTAWGSAPQRRNGVAPDG